MAKDTRQVLAEELRRILEEFRRVDDQAEQIAAERKRLATIAQRLLQILRAQAPRAADGLLESLGLAETIARLPGVPGRKPSRKAPRKARGAAQRPGKVRVAAVVAVQPAVKTASARTPLPKGSAVRLLKGKFKGITGVIGWTKVKGSTVTYTVYLPGTGGKRDRTQITQGSLGKSWEVANEPPPAAAKAVPTARGVTKTGRRRRAAVAPVSASETIKDTTPGPASSSTPLPPGILPKGTPVKMLTGVYLGYTGIVASVQAKPGPKPEAVYTLALKGPGGKKGRTSVKQGTLGRTWTKAG